MIWYEIHAWLIINTVILTKMSIHTCKHTHKAYMRDVNKFQYMYNQSKKETQKYV